MMPFVAAVTLICNVSESSPAAQWHAVVAAEGDERCLRGPQMQRTLFRFLELRNSHFLHENSRNNYVVLKSNHEKTDMGGGPETKN